MKLKHNKYIRCFDEIKSAQLQEAGFLFLFEQNGVYFHKNNDDLTVKFSNTEILEDIKFSSWIGL